MAVGPYILDANVLIEAKNSYYAFSICPGFWEALAASNSTSAVGSIVEVKAELLKQEDDLKAWVSGLPADFFVDVKNAESLPLFGQMQAWARSNGQYSEAAKRAFAENVTDAWLVAGCKSLKATLVTMEKPAPDSRKIIKIPDVCNTFGVSWCNTFDMLTALGASFENGRRKGAPKASHPTIKV